MGQKAGEQRWQINEKLLAFPPASVREQNWNAEIQAGLSAAPSLSSISFNFRILNNIERSQLTSPGSLS